MIKVKTHEAKTHFSRLIARVLGGEEVVVCRGEQPAVRIIPYREGEGAEKRPPVGTITSESVDCTDDAFSPMSSGELKEWGI